MVWFAPIACAEPAANDTQPIYDMLAGAVSPLLVEKDAGLGYAF